jgi:S-adenosylmethionine hydrolase
VPYLPPAVHLAVVDPGVGTARRAVVIETPAGLLVGPDNGLLPWAADALGGATAAAVIANPAWSTGSVSRTFHGRDVFAPAAAQLATGAGPAEAGPALDPADLVRLPQPVVREGAGWLEAEVLTADRFGNLQLAAPAAMLAELDRRLLDRRLRDRRLTVNGEPAVRGATFADAAPGTLVVLVDSAGQVAIAANGASAAAGLGLAAGALVRVERAPGSG